MRRLPFRGTPWATSLIDGTNTVATVITLMFPGSALSYLWTWTSTLVADVLLEISDNYDSVEPAKARWTTVTDAGILAYLAGAGKPSGAPGSAWLQINPLVCAGVRLTITRTGNSGNVTVDAVRY